MRSAAPKIYIGTAGWSLPKAVAPRFVGQGSVLERYAEKFNAVEINSSFYRPHRQDSHLRALGGQRTGGIAILGK